MVNMYNITIKGYFETEKAEETFLRYLCEVRQYCNLSYSEILNLTPRETQIEFESYLKIQENKFNIHRFYDNHFA